MSTQKITEPDKMSHNCEEAHKKTNVDQNKEMFNNNKTEKKAAKKPNNDHLMPTQKIVELQPKDTNIDKKSEDKVTPEEDTQVEMPFISPITHFKVDETPTNRPANPIIQEFEINEESKAENMRQIERIIKTPLSLSQIVAYYRDHIVEMEKNSKMKKTRKNFKNTCPIEIKFTLTSDSRSSIYFTTKPKDLHEDALSSTKRTLRRRNNSSKEAAATSSIDDDGPIVHEALKEIKERNEDGTLKADASINNQVNYDQPTSKMESEKRIKSNKVVSTATSSSKNTQSVAQEKIEDNNKEGPLQKIISARINHLFIYLFYLKGDISVSNEINHDQPTNKRELEKRIKSNKDAATTSSIDNDQPFVQKPSMEIENKNEDGTFEGDIPINNDQPTINKESRIRIKNNKDAARTNSIDNNQTVAQKSEIKDNNENAKLKNASSNETLLSLAKRPKRKQRPKVVFTMLNSPQLESYIKHLGGSVVDSVEACTVLVTQSVKRSHKLLVAVAQGIPICTPTWIQESKKSNEFLDPWDYLLIDKEAEAKWEFSLKESLNRATNKKLFDGYTFQLIVSTAVDVLKGSIKAAGGKIVAKQSKNLDLDKFIVVSSADQKSKYQKMLKQQPHIKIIEPEGIFDGILRQEFRIHRHILK